MGELAILGTAITVLNSLISTVQQKMEAFKWNQDTLGTMNRRLAALDKHKTFMRDMSQQLDSTAHRKDAEAILEEVVLSILEAEDWTELKLQTSRSFINTVFPESLKKKLEMKLDDLDRKLKERFSMLKTLLGVQVLQNIKGLQGTVENNHAETVKFLKQIEEAFKKDDINPEALEIGKELGRGGSGVVYEGTYCRNKTTLQVAVKKLRSHLDGEQVRKMFEKEINNLRRVNRDCDLAHVCRMYGVCVKEGELCLVMKKYSASLLDYLQMLPEGKMQEGHACDMAARIALGLQSLHANNFAHLDTKPQNVLLDEANNAVISDFSVSKHFANEGPRQTMNTDTGAAGTQYYMAPEIASPKIFGKPHFAADIWSFAATMVHMITGAPPFQDFQNEEIIGHLHLKRPMQVPDSISSSELKDLLQQCFDYDQAKRPGWPTILKVLNEVSAMQNLQQVAERAPSTFESSKCKEWPRSEMLRQQPQKGTTAQSESRVPKTSVYDAPRPENQGVLTTLFGFAAYLQNYKNKMFAGYLQSNKHQMIDDLQPVELAYDAKEIKQPLSNVESLVRMLWSSSLELQTQALKGVIRLAADEAFRNEFDNSGGMTALNQLLESGLTNVQLGVLLALASLKPQMNDELIGRVNQSPALVTVIQILSAQSLKEQEEAAKLVASLTSFYSKIRDTLTANGAIPALIKLLASSSSEVQKQATKAAANFLLGCQSLILQQFLSEGGIPNLIHLLSSRNLEVQKEAVRAFETLANECDWEFSIVLIDHGCVAPLLQLLASSSDETQLRSVKALAALSEKSEGESEDQFGEQGSIPALLKFIQGSTSQKAASCAAFIIRRVSHAYSPGIHFQAPMCVPILVKLLAHSSYLVQEDVAYVISSLISCEDTFAEKFMNGGILAPLIELMSSEPEYEDRDWDDMPKPLRRAAIECLHGISAKGSAIFRRDFALAGCIPILIKELTNTPRSAYFSDIDIAARTLHLILGEARTGMYQDEIRSVISKLDTESIEAMQELYETDNAVVKKLIGLSRNIILKYSPRKGKKAKFLFT